MTAPNTIHVGVTKNGDLQIDSKGQAIIGLENVEYVRRRAISDALEMPEVRALVEALREIAGMDLMGASAVAYNALRKIGGDG